MNLESIISKIFSYDSSEPLIFTGIGFWLFFAVTLIGFSLVYKKPFWRSAYLLILSIFFYYKSSGLYFGLLLFTTIIDFYAAKWIYESRNPRERKILVSLSVTGNLFILAYFKYAYFFIESVNQIFGCNLQVVNYLAETSNMIFGSDFSVSKIILPVGISFYTFQAISYLVDVYRQRLKPVDNLIDFGFFVSFFPQLVAGPIVRATDFIPQIYKEYSLSRREFGWAVFLILNGLLKKMVVSDYISINFVDRVFDAPASFTGFENLMAVYGYAIQIYCDFSGYTDIAIGIALLLGFRLPINFDSPYKSNNITNFWRRWHISLSSWLRDYLYISLGGNRKGKVRQYVNLFLTMLLGGLWHGANVRFIIWGGMHGLALAVHKIWMRYVPFSGDKDPIYRAFTTFVTFNFVCFAWIFFRADSMETVSMILNKIISSIDIYSIPQIVASYKNVFMILAFGYIIHWLPTNWKRRYKILFVESSVVIKILACVLVALIVYQAKSSDCQAFIYFQF